ncbi:MAG TPA: carbamoyltransferase N-terminal domain-containing protein, partial [Gallionella sp.]|nr:carbamoyltransferase N-terminal domain-containing protein [Gallionella sp.]
MVILGINGDKRQHNAAASVVIDGKLVSSIEEERISRIKNDSAYPHRAIAEVLSIAGVTEQDVDMVALANLSIWDQKNMRDRILRHDARLAKDEPII